MVSIEHLGRIESGAISSTYVLLDQMIKNIASDIRITHASGCSTFNGDTLSSSIKISTS
jgi:hypothetical protein